MTTQTAAVQRISIKQRIAALKGNVMVGVVALGFVVSSFAAVATGPVASAATAPAPSDAAATQYGSIGKWMLKFTGQVADYGGQPYQGRTLLEPVNVIVVDPTSRSSLESVTKLNWQMAKAGFPVRPGHSSGFKGMVNGKTYTQQPASLTASAYSDDSFLVKNNHGRMFGPASVTGGGYVYSGAFSTEVPIINVVLLMHAYVSSNVARDKLAANLTAGGHTRGANIDLANAYNTIDTTTGDHDGAAAVIVLK